MACSHWDERVLGLAKNSYQVHRGGKLRDARPHCLCLEILLEHGFPVETPDNAIYSCADLASLKRVCVVDFCCRDVIATVPIRILCRLPLCFMLLLRGDSQVTHDHPAK